VPRSFVTARHDALYRDAVEGLLGDLGKKVKVEIVPPDADATFCPNCIWDPVHNCSTGRYNQTGSRRFTGKTCPVCNNAGKISEARPVRVPEAIVRFGRVMPSDGAKPLPQGELPIGYARIRCKIKFKPKVKAARHFLLDGRRHVRDGEIRDRGLKTPVAIEFVVKLDA
jgi:hypothetical protein